MVKPSVAAAAPCARSRVANAIGSPGYYQFRKRQLRSREMPGIASTQADPANQLERGLLDELRIGTNDAYRAVEVCLERRQEPFQLHAAPFERPVQALRSPLSATTPP